jgi:hypothetical protein
MKVEVYQKAIIKSRCIDACKSTTSLFITGASNEVAYKGIDLLLELDGEFKNKLLDLLVETEKRLQKEFDEL